MLLFVALGRFLCTFLVPIIDPSEYTWFLVFAFCFGLSEAYLFCRSMYMLDSGLTYLSLRSDSREIYRSTGGTALGMTIIFTVVKNVFAIFPALTYLVTDYGEVTEAQTNWTFVMWMLMAINVLLVTVYGILWYIRMRRFWKPLKESKFLSRVEERYATEYLANRPLTVYRDLKRISLLLGLAFLFAVPVRMDGIDILPDIAAGVLMIFAARFLKRMYPGAAEKTVLLSSLYTVVATVEWGLMVWFSMTNFGPELIEQQVVFSDWMGYKVFREMDLFMVFAVYCVLAALKLGILGTVVISMRRALKRMIVEHTGSITEVGQSTEKTAKIRKTLNELLRAVLYFIVFAVLFSVLTTVLFLWFPILQTFDLFVWAAYAILMHSFTEKLLTSIDDRYYYDT